MYIDAFVKEEDDLKTEISGPHLGADSKPYWTVKFWFGNERITLFLSSLQLAKLRIKMSEDLKIEEDTIDIEPGLVV